MKIYTIRDIAALSGASVSTVSRVLNGRHDVSDATKRKVMAVVERYNYTQNRNAKNLKQRNANLVSIIARGRQNNFLTDIAERVINCGHQNGHNFLLDIIDEKDDEIETARQLLAERRIRGAIFLGANIAGREGEIAQMKLPCVFATVDVSRLGIPSASSVSIDNRKGARMAIEHLLDMGHRRIAVFGGRREIDDGIGQRHRGVVEAYEARGLMFDEALYTECSFVMQKAHATAAAHLEGAPPAFTAVFAMGDMMAIGIIKALYDAGLRVPDDISVVGFDGIPLSRYTLPPLTTIVQPADEIARISVELMLRLLKDADDTQSVVVESELLVGGSVRAIGDDY